MLQRAFPAAILFSCVTAFAATATFTGRFELVTSVTGQLVYNCEYMYAAQKFWRAFKSSCPYTIEIE